MGTLPIFARSLSNRCEVFRRKWETSPFVICATFRQLSIRDTPKMRTRSAAILIAIFLILAGNSLAKTPKVKTLKISWQDGQVISAVLNGRGSNSNARGVQQGIWWSYCISTADKSYSVISGLSPSKSDLLQDKPVRIGERKGQLLILNSAGMQIEMRIVGKSSSGKCPQ